MEIKDVVKDPTDYFKRQERVNLDEMSYNHEQFKRYTNTFNKAKAMDDAHQKNIYKVVRYVKENKDNTGDLYVKKFTEVDGYDPDLIEVPEEFKDLPLDDLENVGGRKFAQRKVIKRKSCTNLSKYDAWRCWDRAVLKGDGKHHGVATLYIAPAQLVRTFGFPHLTQIMAHGSGEYNFEDSNLDCYSIFDYK
jgi:hypothetical protein